MAGNLPKIALSEAEMRQKFNDGRFEERTRRGDLRRRLDRDDHPSPEASGHPDCTRSQMITYVNRSGRPVALIHQYLLPNGNLGGSGLPDPKGLWLSGCFYYPKSKRSQTNLPDKA